MYKKYICIGITIDNIILGKSKTPKILNIVLEEEIDVQGAIWISSGPVQGIVKPSSTGNSAEGATTGFSTGRRIGMGGETLC